MNVQLDLDEGDLSELGTELVSQAPNGSPYSVGGRHTFYVEAYDRENTDSFTFVI